MYPRVGRKMAKIKVRDSKTKMKIGLMGTIEFPFNPTEMTLKRGKTFDSGDTAGNANYTGLKWEKSELDSLDFTFIIDESEDTPSLSNPLAALHQMLPISPIPPNLLPSKMAKFLPGVNGNSVKDTVDDLYRLTLLVDKTDESGVLKRPSLIDFVWGDFEFAGGVESLDVKYLLFDSDGTPKRAEVTMSLKGQYAVGKRKIKDTDLTNPSKISGSASLP